jgi:hypothetical protein
VRCAVLECVRFFARVDPADAEAFRTVRLAMSEAERRRVTDAEVFCLAVQSLLASGPEYVKQKVATAAG